MDEGVAELAALVDGAGGFRRDVARDPAGKRELAKQAPQPLLVAADVWIDLGVGALEIAVGDQARPAVPRPGHVDRVEIVADDRAVHVRVDEVEARRRSEERRVGKECRCRWSPY